MGFPGKNTGVGGHCLLQGFFLTQGSNPGLLYCRQILYHLSHWCACTLSLQSFLTLCDPIDHSLPGFSVHKVLQARILEWVALLSSRGSSQLRDRNCILHLLHRQVDSSPLAPPGKPLSHWLSSVQSFSHVRLFATLWIAAHQASLSITSSRSLLKFMSIKLVMPSSHLILCCPLLLLPPIPPSIRVFSKESTLHMRWPKYWSFSFSVSPPNDHSGLISFRMDWLDLLAVQGTLKESSPTLQFKSINFSSQSNSHIHTWPLEKP